MDAETEAVARSTRDFKTGCLIDINEFLDRSARSLKERMERMVHGRSSPHVSSYYLAIRDQFLGICMALAHPVGGQIAKSTPCLRGFVVYRYKLLYSPGSSLVLDPIIREEFHEVHLREKTARAAN